MKRNREPKNFHPDPFAYHEEIEIEIDTLTNLGHGLGRLDGWVVLVPFSLPGETVRARVYRNHRNYSDADLVDVLAPSPERIDPACPLFGECGGCQYQNLGYEAQLRWKRQQVGELLSHMAKVEFEVNPVIASPRPYGYRSKITPHFQKPRKGGSRIGPIGFLRNGRRHEIVDVPACPIAMDSINQALPGIRERVRDRSSTYKKGATLLLRASGEDVVDDAKAVASESVGPLSFRFPAGDFFQNNPFILEAFTSWVTEQAAASGARFLVDAYCGSGLFCLSAANAFEAALGIEISENSITWASQNAERNGIANCRFLAGKVEDLFGDVEWNGAECAVIVDPPRKGCSGDFLGQLFAFAPATVVYVSCNPATQMRDLVKFREAGFALQNVQPFDLFPQTRHLECVMTLRRS